MKMNMKMIVLLFGSMLLSSAAIGDDLIDKQKHSICAKHPPAIVSKVTGQLKWPEGFESCEASEKAWATSQAKRADDERADREGLDRLNNPNAPRPVAPKG